MSVLLSEKSGFYSPFSFLTDPSKCAGDFVCDLEKDLGDLKVFQFSAGNEISIFYRTLDWDTKFFGVPTFRIDYTQLPLNVKLVSVQLAFLKFRKYLSSLCSSFYLFAEVPSEDTAVIAGMSGAGCRLIETRVTCFRDDLQNFTYKTQSETRDAVETDIPELRIAAVQAVNPYDRFHADDFFTSKEADDFLAIFIENSVKGFADEVIVPTTGPANAFLTGNYVATPHSLFGRKIGKMVFSAATPARRGWYVKLIGELSLKFKENGLDTAFMTTQATNRAVLKVWFKHGYRFGRCTHIFSTYTRVK
jgi:dTDP-4-amino-4,6-dideoxy-D-galactose acyltransferase